MFKIQRGDPPPAKPYRSRKYPIDLMEVGDWFFIPSRSVESVSSHLHTIAKRLGRKVKLGAVYMCADENGDWMHCSRKDTDAVDGVCVTRVE